jgi:hypothetical protein
MAKGDKTLADTSRRQEFQLRQNLHSWSGHVANQTDIPTHLIRYEDLLEDTAGALSRALAFAGVQVSADRINQAVAACNFALLRAQERQNGLTFSPLRRLSRRQHWRRMSPTPFAFEFLKFRPGAHAFPECGERDGQ